eukprot:scaffold66187_cov72-Phaeocystis_antarctica.AAC.1
MKKACARSAPTSARRISGVVESGLISACWRMAVSCSVESLIHMSPMSPVATCVALVPSGSVISVNVPSIAEESESLQSWACASVHVAARSVWTSCCPSPMPVHAEALSGRSTGTSQECGSSAATVGSAKLSQQAMSLPAPSVPFASRPKNSLL